MTLDEEIKFWEEKQRETATNGYEVSFRNRASKGASPEFIEKKLKELRIRKASQKGFYGVHEI